MFKILVFWHEAFKNFINIYPYMKNIPWNPNFRSDFHLITWLGGNLKLVKNGWLGVHIFGLVISNRKKLDSKLRHMARKIKNGPNRTYVTFRGEAEDGKFRFGAFFFYCHGWYIVKKIWNLRKNLCSTKIIFI